MSIVTKTEVPLAQRTCLACSSGTDNLSGEIVGRYLGQLQHGWAVTDDVHLERAYTFGNFKSALAFVDKVGKLAERQRHHPDIYLAWGKVKVMLWTHKTQGLTEEDFIMAAKIDKVKMLLPKGSRWHVDLFGIKKQTG